MQILAPFLVNLTFATRRKNKICNRLPRNICKIFRLPRRQVKAAAATDLSMVAADIYRSVVGMKWAYQRTGDCAGATNILRAETGLPGRMHLRSEKSEQKAHETPTIPWPIGPSDLPGESGFGQDNCIREERRPPAAPCADAPRHEYECPERRPEVRKAGIRIPGHIRPPLASPSNSFGTSQPSRHAAVYSHSRDALSVVT